MGPVNGLDVLLQLLLLGDLGLLEGLRLALEERDAETPLLCVDVLLNDTGHAPCSSKYSHTDIDYCT